MSKGSSVSHALNLSVLINNLNQIGEDVCNIESVLKEPIWTPDEHMHTMCDLIILYNNHTAVAGELKHSKKQLSKAVLQLQAGKEYIESVLKYEYKYGIFIIYNTYSYTWERI